MPELAGLLLGDLEARGEHVARGVRRARRPPSPDRSGRRSRRAAPRSAFRGRSRPPPGRRRPGEAARRSGAAAARRPAGGRGGAERDSRSVPRSEDVRAAARPRPRPRWARVRPAEAAPPLPSWARALRRRDPSTTEEDEFSAGAGSPVSKGASSEGEGTAASGRGLLGSGRRALEERLPPRLQVVLRLLPGRQARFFGPASLETAQQIHERQLRDQLERLGHAAARPRRPPRRTGTRRVRAPPASPRPRGCPRGRACCTG